MVSGTGLWNWSLELCWSTGALGLLRWSLEPCWSLGPLWSTEAKWSHHPFLVCNCSPIWLIRPFCETARSCASSTPVLVLSAGWVRGSWEPPFGSTSTKNVEHQIGQSFSSGVLRDLLKNGYDQWWSTWVLVYWALFGLLFGLLGLLLVSSGCSARALKMTSSVVPARRGEHAHNTQYTTHNKHNERRVFTLRVADQMEPR